MRSSKRTRNVIEGREVVPVRTRPDIVYHHTSTLRTNLIWMSGLIQLEGHTEGLVWHPQLGEIKTNANLRRDFEDFPRLAWFTRRIEVPKVLVRAKFMGQKPDGEIIDFGRLVDFGKHADHMGNMLSLNRLALGFPTDSIPVVPWPDHYGYSTKEGQELNETAREAGDNPTDWWVSDTPVDVLCATEVWISGKIVSPKLIKNERYLPEIKRMVTSCRENNGYIPPSWMSIEDQRKLGRRLGLPISE